MVADFDGIAMPEDEKETIESNEIYTLVDLSKVSYKKLSQLVGEDSAKAIEDSLIEKTGWTLKNSQRKSLKTSA